MSFIPEDSVYAKARERAEKAAREAEKARQAEKRDVLREIREAVDFYRLTPREIFKKSELRAQMLRLQKPSAKLYREPETGDTWNGRGRPPEWLRRAEAAGKDREAFRVVDDEA